MIKPINQISLVSKTRNLPKGLIYKVPNNECYKFIETKKGKQVGEMWASVVAEMFSPYNMPPKTKCYKIDLFEIDPSCRKRRWGEYFFDFAKKQSYLKGCEGRLYLYAYHPGGTPQIFYKKQGMVAASKIVDEKLENYIKTKNYPKSHPICKMYLPIISETYK